MHLLMKKIGFYLRSLSLFINSSPREGLTLGSIMIYIYSSFPTLEEDCGRLDSFIENERITLDKVKFLNKIREGFDRGKYGFDSMGYFTGYYELNSSLLENHSKIVIYEGTNFEININNFNKEEQLVLGTISLI